MASSGSFTTTSCEGRSLTFSWSIQSQSIANNTTTIAWDLTGSGSYTYGWVTCGGFNVVINGTTVYDKSTDYRINVYNGTVITSGTHTISHSSDGTKTFSASVSAGIYEYARNCSGSGSWELTTIPRKSSFSLSASSINVDTAITATISPASSSFSHKVRFYIDDSRTSESFSLVAGTKTKSYTIPASWLSSTTSCTVYCNVATYNGSAQNSSTHIGYVKQSFTVNVPNTAAYNPAVGTITIDPVNITTNDGVSRNILVQGKNKVTVSVSGSTAGSGSTIQSYTFSGPQMNTTTTTNTSATSNVVSSTGTLTYAVRVTDNRGRWISKAATITCYPYTTPYFTSFSAIRTNANGTADANGSYIKCSYGISYSSVNGTNNITVKIYYKKNTASSYQSVTTLSNSTTTSGTQLLSSIDTSSTYTIYATVTDNYNSSSPSSNATVFSVERVFNVRPSGSGAAFGKMADVDGVLDSKWPIKTDDPANTMNNLSFKGTNFNINGDTTASWAKQGNLTTVYYGANNGYITNQPTAAGFLLNVTNGDTQVHQLWATQSQGDIYHRGGNSGASTLAGNPWRQLLDTVNYTTYVSPKPFVLYNNSSGEMGTVALSDSAANYSYLEIFLYKDNASGWWSVRVPNPNGKVVQVGTQYYTAASGVGLQLIGKKVTISGKSITSGTEFYMNFHDSETKITALGGQTSIKIMMVVGYK